MNARRKHPAIPELAVARNVYRNNGGWIVRVMRNGSSHQKYFADNQYGGQVLALDAANTYSEWLREYLAAPPEIAKRKCKSTMPLPTIAKPREAGISGMLGVTQLSTRGRNGQVSRCWVATWPVTKPGETKTQSFAVSRYGEAEALALAIETRQAAMQALAEGANLDRV